MPLLYVTFCISLVRDIYIFIGEKSNNFETDIFGKWQSNIIALTNSGNQMNQSNLIVDPVQLPSARKCFSWEKGGRFAANRLFRSSENSHFQNEAKSKTILVNMTFSCVASLWSRDLEQLGNGLLQTQNQETTTIARLLCNLIWY